MSGRAMLAIFVLVWWAACAGRSGEKEMSKTNAIFYEVESGEPIKSEVEATPIRSAPATALPPPATPAGLRGTPRPHGSARLDGRAASPVPEGRWSVAWQRDLEAAFVPAFVLQAGDRIGLQEGESFLLLDREGRPIKRRARSEGDLVLDAEQGLLYANDENALVTAFELANAEKRFAVAAHFGRGWRRDVLAVRAHTVLLRSFELPQMAKPMRPPEYTVFEVQDLGDSIAVDDGMVSSAVRRASLMSRTTPILSAVDGEELLVAVPGHLLRLDANLRVRSDRTAEFDPIALSVDETGRAHIVVRAENGTRLWVVTREGERTLDVEIAIGSGTLTSPPIIGYDHTVFLVGPSGVLVIPPDGATSHTLESGRRVAGAVATPDLALVAVSGSEVVRIDAEGRRDLLFDATEPLVTPPAQTSEGTILVASENHLFHLVPAGPVRPAPRP